MDSLIVVFGMFCLTLFALALYASPRLGESAITALRDVMIALLAWRPSHSKRKRDALS